MASIQGDQFIRTLAHYLRSNEHKLAAPRQPPKETFTGVGVTSANTQKNALSSTMGAVTSLFGVAQAPTPRRPAGNISTGDSPPASIYGVPTSYLPFYPTSRPQSPSNSSTLTLDPQHLYFLLVQFEHIGLDIGDPALLGAIPENGVVETETSATENKAPSIMSMASNISTLSLSTGWNLWERRSKHQESKYSIEDEITYIYKVLSHISSLKLHLNLTVHPQSGATRSGSRIIKGYEVPLPQDGKSLRISATPFRSLTHLELINVHPRMIDGWIALQDQLTTLIIKAARVEDINEVIVEEIAASLQKRGQFVPREEDEETVDLEQLLGNQTWSKLKHLSLADNSIPSLDNAPLHHIQSLEHFDLSSNLLIDIPNSLTTLYNLRSLNLAHNMVSSVTGVNTILGNVQELDLRGNRLTMLAGLDRLWSLERLDIRNNRLEETGEVGRLAALPGIKEVWVEGNPFTVHEPNYRVVLFNQFKAANDNDVLLDGTGPSAIERRHVIDSANDNGQVPAAIVASASQAKQPLAASVSGPKQGKSSDQPKKEKTNHGKQKKHKRIVRLDSEQQIPPDSEDSADISAEDNKNQDANNRRVLRYAELEADSRSRSRSPKPHSHSSKRKPRKAPVPMENPVAGDEYRKKIEAMRNEAGSGWLRVLNEMEDSNKQ
ncbi:hypothetical protein VKS41_007448 [Umbelopsis sp. WA50703]